MSNRTFSYNLNLPNYKQFTGGWEDDRTSCGGTMHSDGCYITSNAMVFDYYDTSKTITPETVLNALYPYGADCPFDWFKASQVYGYADSQVLGNFVGLKDSIFEHLKKGVPVLAAVNGHMVVVDQFYGTLPVSLAQDGTEVIETSAITADMFKINDPGSSYRTMLSEVMTAYNSDLVKIVIWTK